MIKKAHPVALINLVIAVRIISTLSLCPASLALALHSVHVWDVSLLPFSLHELACRRNDFISTVREAAHTALGQIGGAEAEKVLRVTDILQKEIAYLAKS